MSHSDSVQVRYDRILANGLPGSISDANPTTKESFISEDIVIPYGVVISRGSINNANGGTQTGRVGTTGSISATSGFAQGTGILEESLAAWLAIDDGEFSIEIDGVQADIDSIDFTSITSLDDVAAAIQVAVRLIASGGFTLATVVNENNHNLRITSGLTGATTSVSDLSTILTPAGTDISELSGMDSAFNQQGLAATSLAVLGINLRVLISESVSVSDSGSTGTKIEEIGAVIREGSVKVLASESAADNDDVYFDNTTGEIFASAAGGRTQLGTSKFRGAVVAGEVGVIDITGVRGA